MTATCETHVNWAIRDAELRVIFAGRGFEMVLSFVKKRGQWCWWLRCKRCGELKRERKHNLRHRGIEMQARQVVVLPPILNRLDSARQRVDELSSSRDAVLYATALKELDDAIGQYNIYNHDMTALMRSLEDKGPEPTERRVVS